MASSSSPPTTTTTTTGHPSAAALDSTCWRRRRQAYAKSCSTPTHRTLRILADYFQGHIDHGLTASGAKAIMLVFSPGIRGY
ncbi:hypothetical protein Pcinc_018131 [Petrolisthes cinctipes]|uniref:Uncharacterized protein n=1 Tax=Petrolisthes cinctipes TaxID=88211 RepID=A0AAE1FP82_PETCI|nr:hypothetical protein Pcinc_018131 [Petrolisthes cinctipes]